MRPKKPILLYCADRELLSTTTFALRLHPYEVTAIDDSRSAAAIMMASELVCGILIHARQGDPTGRLIHRLLESDRLPLRRPDADPSHGRARRTMRTIAGRGPPTLCFCSREHGKRQRMVLSQPGRSVALVVMAFSKVFL